MLDDLTARVNNALSGTAAAGVGTATAVAPEDHSALVAKVVEMIDSRQIGGVAGLVKRLQAKGLGNIVSGWVSTGPNPPISAAQLETALGTQTLQQLADKSGLSLQSLTSKLATILPIVVDFLTPDGKLPSAGGLFSTAMDWLKGRR
jgi:uncharacterized protein YidB (DUF937 family)